MKGLNKQDLHIVNPHSSSPLSDILVTNRFFDRSKKENTHTQTHTIDSASCMQVGVISSLELNIVSLSLSLSLSGKCAVSVYL